MDKTAELKAWYFTFGSAHPLKDHIQTIHAPSSDAARLKMLECYGQKWSGQYDGEQLAEIERKWRRKYSFLPPVNVSKEEAESLACRFANGQEEML